MEEKKQVIKENQKRNSMGYSDEWQPYQGDYDKFEYDVKLKDGTVVENCYPNAGKFNSISDEHNAEDFGEELVSEIRFSNAPRFGINKDVSDIPQYDWLDKKLKENDWSDKNLKEDSKEDFPFNNSYLDLDFTRIHPDFNTYPKPSQYKREAPKVHNNDLCACGSGKKFKKCCKNKN